MTMFRITKQEWTYISRFRIFLDFKYQGGVKSTVFGVLEDFKLKFVLEWCYSSITYSTKNIMKLAKVVMADELTKVDPELVTYILT